jgi:hypothetical protein
MHHPVNPTPAARIYELERRIDELRSLISLRRKEIVSLAGR